MCVHGRLRECASGRCACVSLRAAPLVWDLERRSEPARSTCDAQKDETSASSKRAVRGMNGMLATIVSTRAYV
eukprot:6204560-Pleurochrysis_carterae.AAC.1